MSALGAIAAGANTGLQQARSFNQAERQARLSAMLGAAQLELQSREQADVSQARERGLRISEATEARTGERFTSARTPYNPTRNAAIAKEFGFDPKMTADLPREEANKLIMGARSIAASGGGSPGAIMNALRGVHKAAVAPIDKEISNLEQVVSGEAKSFTDIMKLMSPEVVSKISGVPEEDLASAKLTPGARAALVREARRLLENKYEERRKIMDNLLKQFPQTEHLTLLPEEETATAPSTPQKDPVFGGVADDLDAVIQQRKAQREQENVGE